MVRKIESKITSYCIKDSKEAVQPKQPDEHLERKVVQMHETVQRPEHLAGTTYKLKTPDHISEHSLFITINDIVLNEGTPHEIRRPFEIFINSKSVEHYQWIVALTRIMSAVFRKGGDITFLVEELHSVFDPQGGYWNKGKYVPSLIAEIGNIIEQHLKHIGLLQQESELGNGQVEEKSTASESAPQLNDADSADDHFPVNAALCKKCLSRSLVQKDGCMTCLNCGDSKCG